MDPFAEAANNRRVVTAMRDMAKIQVAVKARSSPDFLIVARTDADAATLLSQNIDPKDLTQETVADVCAITKSATSLIVELCGADGRRLEFDEKTFSIHTKDSSQLSTWSVSNFPLCGSVLLAKVYLDPNELVGVLRDQRRRLSQEACGEADPNLSSPIVVQPAYEAEAELDTHGRRLPAEAEPATHGRRLAGGGIRARPVADVGHHHPVVKFALPLLRQGSSQATQLGPVRPLVQ